MTLRLDRIEQDDEILIDIISCEEQPHLNDTAMACRTVDVSEQGMRVAANMSIPVRSVLSLRLDLPDQLYRLEGVVRWSRDDEGFNLGLLLSDQSQDLQAWTERFQIDF